MTSTPWGRHMCLHVVHVHITVATLPNLRTDLFCHLSSIDESSENEVHYDVDNIPVGTHAILRDHLAAACAHELNLTQIEWDTVTTFLTALSQPRRTSKENSSNLGESRASNHYNCTVIPRT